MAIVKQKNVFLLNNNKKPHLLYINEVFFIKK